MKHFKITSNYEKIISNSPSRIDHYFPNSV